MSKLKLNLDTLRIESFETSHPAATIRGTVRGLQDSVGATAFCANTAYCSGHDTYTCDQDGDTFPDSTNTFPNTTTNAH